MHRRQSVRGVSASDGEKSPTFRLPFAPRSGNSSGSENTPAMIRRPVRSTSTGGLPTTPNGSGGSLNTLGIAMGSTDILTPRGPGRRGRGRNRPSSSPPGKILVVFCLLATLSVSSLYLGIRAHFLSRRLGDLNDDLDRSRIVERDSRRLQQTELERSTILEAKLSSLRAQKDQLDYSFRELQLSKSKLEENRIRLEREAAEKDQELMTLRRNLLEGKTATDSERETWLKKENEDLKTRLERTVVEKDHELLIIRSEMEEKEILSGRGDTESALRMRMKDLRAHIARESYRSTVERFGPGPHKVAMRLELPADTESFPDMPKNPVIIIQLNPLDKMPLSVHLFLEQVSHELWDGHSFNLNAGHILQAGGGGTNNNMQEFKDMRLDKLSYQEYHKDYPHEKYTIGFSGRPGGHDFYINKVNNTKPHGQGGQTHMLLNEEADPCFGRILEGQEIIDRIGAMPFNKRNMLATPVTILRAEVLGVEVLPSRWKPDMNFDVIEVAAIASGGDV